MNDLNTLRDEIYQDAIAHGLWEDCDDDLCVDLLDNCYGLINDEVEEIDNAVEDFCDGCGIDPLTEELADVYCCIDLVIEALKLSAFEIISIANFKKTRWAERLRNASKEAN